MYFAIGVSPNPYNLFFALGFIKYFYVWLLYSVNPRGKVQAIRKETIPKLVNLLQDSDPEVKASAAGALAL